MAAGVSVLDRFVTEFLFRADSAALTKIEKRVEGMRSRLNRMSLGATIAGASITAAGGKALTTFASYESQMAKIEGLVGVARQQIVDWQPEIERISKLTGKSLNELGDALFFTTSAGLRGSVAMNILEESAKGSAIGLGEQKDIVDLATSAINAFGAENLTATQVLDELTNAVRLGKLEADSMAGSMGRLFPLGSKLGLTFQELAGLMAAMSRTGTTAEESVTQLSAVMAALIKPADEAEKRLKSVGLSAAGLRKFAREKGLFEMLQLVNTALDGSEEKLGEVFPNIRALRGVFDLLGPGLQANKEIIDGMSQSAETLNNAFEISQRTLTQEFLRTMASLGERIKSVGERLKPTAVIVLQFVRDMADQFARLSEPVQSFIAHLFVLGPGLLLAGGAMSAMSFALGGLMPVLRGWNRILRIGERHALGTRIELALLSAQMKLQALWTSISGVVTARWTQIVNWAKNSTALLNAQLLIATARQKALSIWTAASSAATTRFAGAMGALKGTALFKAGATFATWFKGSLIFKALGVFAALLTAKIVILGAILAAAALLIYKYWEPIKTFFEGIWQGFLTTAAPAIDRLSDSFGKLWGEIVALFAPVELTSEEFDALKAAGMAVGEAIGGAFNIAIGIVELLVKTISYSIKLLRQFLEWVGLAQEQTADATRVSLPAENERRTPEVSLPGELEQSGQQVPATLAQGISEEDAVKNQIESNLADASRLLPQSDALEGPFANLTNAGRSIMRTIAQGISQTGAAPIRDAVLSALAGLSAPLAVGPVLAGAAAGSAPGQGVGSRELTINIGDITINTTGANSEELAANFSDRLTREIRSAIEQVDSPIKL